MFYHVRDQLLYNKAVVQIAKQLNPSSGSPLQYQEHSGEDLGHCKSAKTKSTELEHLPIQGYEKIWLRIWVDGNMKVNVFQVDGERRAPPS